MRLYATYCSSTSCRKKERSEPDGLLYIVHADDFHNPEGNMGLAKSHCGLHDVMMEGVYENPLFTVHMAVL